MVLSMKELQAYGTDMLREVSMICQQENISYQALYGTLLGAIRHHGPIPWDYDIDIAVPENEYERFVETMKKRLPSSYWVDFREDPDNPKPMARIGLKGYDTFELHIDVYRLFGLPDSKLYQFFICILSRTLISFRCAKVYSYRGIKKLLSGLIRAATFYISPGYIVKWYDRLCQKYPVEKAKYLAVGTSSDIYCITKEETMKTVLVPYADYMLAAPACYDDILKKVYGDYLSYPPKEYQERMMTGRYVIAEMKE